MHFNCLSVILAHEVTDSGWNLSKTRLDWLPVKKGSLSTKESRVKFG